MDEKRAFLKKRSQELRREMTPQETNLWYRYLRGFPMHVHRQKVIGPYIVDFYIAKRKLVIEIDGTQHFLEDGKVHDQIRDEYLKNRGMTIMRFGNNEVNKQFESVCQAIWNFCYGDENCISEDVLLGEK